MQKYQILGVIGEGAYGLVLKCRNKQTKKLVAIKKFKENENDQNIRKIILRQIQVLKALRHPNIVELRQAFKKKGIYFLVFQYLDNNMLEILECSKKGFDRRLIAKYIYQVLLGISFMHSNNYIHRDIKPQNLLINRQNGVRICDMGFARRIGNSSQKLTDYVATRWYRSPELLLGMSYGPPADIWATGCLMAQFIDGDALFPGEDEIDQIKKIQDLFFADFTNCRTNLTKVEYMNGQYFATQRLKGKFSYKIPTSGINLLRRMLQINPQKRITALESLNHSFFDSIRGQFSEPNIQSPFQSKDLNVIFSKKINIRDSPLSNLQITNRTNKTEYGSIKSSFNIKKKSNFYAYERPSKYFWSKNNENITVLTSDQNSKSLGLNRIYGKRDDQNNKDKNEKINEDDKMNDKKIPYFLTSSNLSVKIKNFRNRLLK